ncbi:hypothetical protein ALC60_03260 [Trachymyrmex zeteki]|uniref:Uncharacterized protein n=1 Tax=Mycetomoellerius zeteki TaxID=64791 RepID=A0A151XBN8_9HYME|nr:hypothetical protein ALC60_03260 [Trachymyrmex zeteki]
MHNSGATNASSHVGERNIKKRAEHKAMGRRGREEAYKGKRKEEEMEERREDRKRERNRKAEERRCWHKRREAADKERLCEKQKEERERVRNVNVAGEEREREREREKTSTREDRGGEGAGDVCTLKYYSQMKYRAGPAGTQRARIFLDLI